MSVDRDFAIFGTEETVLTVRRFSVGILSFGLESGGIRHVRYGGHEVMRGIQYLLRDRLWATPAVELDDPELQVSTDSVSIRYRGVVRSGDIHYRLAAAILATADGRLEFKVEGRAVSAFEANRIGFTLLHPTPQCEGIELTIEHGDGSLEETRFPLRISPAQHGGSTVRAVFDATGHCR